MKTIFATLALVLAAVLLARTTGKRRPPASPPPLVDREILIDLSHFPPYLLTSFRGPTIPRA